MANGRPSVAYKNFNFRVAITSILAVAAGFFGIRIASRRTADKGAEADDAFMQQLRHAIEYPQRRRGRRTEPGISALLLDRLASSGVCDAPAVDQLITGSRAAARETLGLQTLAQTDRLLSALRLARNEIGASGAIMRH
jgi:hypothetical protein